MLQSYMPSQFLKSSLYRSSQPVFAKNISGVFTLLLAKDHPRAWWLPKLMNMSNAASLKSEAHSALDQAPRSAVTATDTRCLETDTNVSRYEYEYEYGYECF